MRKPLQAKIKKDVKWEWTEENTKYIDKIKKKITVLPPMYIPKEEEKLIIETDASQTYWGGILKAETFIENNRIEKICAYASGTFQGAQLNYHSNELEILAIIKTIKKFAIYLIPQEFIIRSDNNFFGYFLRTNITGDYKQGRLIRWQQWFNYYKFKVEHIAGEKNYLADALTRELHYKYIYQQEISSSQMTTTIIDE